VAAPTPFSAASTESKSADLCGFAAGPLGPPPLLIVTPDDVTWHGSACMFTADENNLPPR
jgi:hypothetical protein